jgi:phasin family protein
MARTARTEADEAIGVTENVTDKVTSITRDVTGTVFEKGRAAAGRSTEVAAELGQVFANLVNEQAKHNVEVLRTLTQAANWGEVVKIQNDYVRTSIERAVQFTRRYFEVAQAVMSSTTSVVQDRAQKAS